MTDELERQAEEVFARLDELGQGSMLEGVHTGNRDGLVPGEIATRPTHWRKKISSGRRVVVGVNRFAEADDELLPTLYIGPRSSSVSSNAWPRCAVRAPALTSTQPWPG